MCNLKWARKDICTKDLAGLFLADELALPSALTCNSTQRVDVCIMFTWRKRFSINPKKINLVLWCISSVKKSVKICQNVRLAWNEGPAEDKWH